MRVCWPTWMSLSFVIPIDSCGPCKIVFGSSPIVRSPRCHRIHTGSIAWHDVLDIMQVMVELQGNDCWLITSATPGEYEGFTRRPSVAIIAVNPEADARADSAQEGFPEGVAEAMVTPEGPESHSGIEAAHLNEPSA
ncbi:protein of unknown function [Candidatus Methylomirabilis oxygeniifera]|uniref:Uncharacterized protein n=1 Tax=Methylomirabilis oxygeniifera TaxID=671143 RepID=D5MN19_METO1|nr:protein of unknown function [Candidatus Methylomirabilis oxyfera]